MSLNMKKILPLAIFSLLIIQVSGQKIPFQGKLIEAGLPVNEPRTLEFGIPDLGWNEAHTNVQITDGFYFVVLGSVNPLPANLFSGADERQINLSVDGTALGPVTLYKPFAADLSEIKLERSGSGLLRAGFRTGTEFNENKPFLSLKGNFEGERLSLNLLGDNEGTFEAALINLNTTAGYFMNLRSETLFFNTPNAAAGLYTSNELWFRNNNIYTLQLVSQNWSNNGFGGTILLRGPNSMNIEIGNKHWESSDLPRILMSGSTSNAVIELSGVKYEENGIEKERGVIQLENTDGRKSTLTSDYLTFSNSSGEETTYANNGTWGSGSFNMWSGAMVNGTLTVNGDIQGSGTNNYNSDERLKSGIRPLDNNVLSKIESLGSYSYYWKKQEFPEKNFSAGQQIGLIAQELEKQFPALVKTGEDGFKSVNYNGFTAVLLQAVKELNAKIDKLESENQLLHSELMELAIKSTELENIKSQIAVLVKMVQEKSGSSPGMDTAETITTNTIK
jgi:hypothetical protein